MGCHLVRVAPREHEGAALSAGGGVWRVAFAFDPERKAILLVAGDKSGVSERRFYRSLIDKADHRYQQHLALRAMGQRRIH